MKRKNGYVYSERTNTSWSLARSTPESERSMSARRRLLATTLLISLLALAPPALGFSPLILMRPTGEEASNQLGGSVSDAGDVNGDGYADVIVGEAFNDAAGTDAGRAYVYYGGAQSDDVADMTLTGAAAGDTFGYSVSGAGDVNGDGYDDVIVGAPGNDAGGANAGRAYVYYGGPVANAVADLVLTGTGDEQLGFSVSGAGDVNGDGFADVIVGGTRNDAGGVNAGRAYVYHGGPGADPLADLVFTGAAAGDEFGWSVSGAGDINGDGYADVIVGAASNDAAGLSAGRAYVYHGGPGADTVADLIFTGATTGDNLGASVSAGDINGDGYSDLIVGAPLNDAAGGNAGRAYVYWGGPSADAVADLIFTGVVAGDQLGISVSGAGDMNGDGYVDVIVGAPYQGSGGPNAGRAYIYLGGPTADNIADVTLTGAAVDDVFSFRVSGAGDLNGDGYGEVIVGALANDAGALDGGRAYVYTSLPYHLLSPNGGEQWVVGRESVVRWLGRDLADVSISFDGGASYSLLASGAGGGETNQLVVTVPTPTTAVGKVRVSVTGATVTLASSDASVGVFSIVEPWTPPAAAHQLLASRFGAAPVDEFGKSVSSAGDVNGDGYADVIVGAPRNDAAGPDAGSVYVYFGGPGADATADLTLTGSAGSDAFGSRVSDAGDMNGDGYGDVIVGAPGNGAGGSGAGRAYVYFGGPAPDGTADLTFTGAAVGDQLGSSVSSAGDVNGDGYSDVIVGAYFNDAGGVDAGRAYVYFGGPGADAVADLTFTGTAATEQFGVSVSRAGDLNADGYADLIVGAAMSDAGGADAGRAYVYFGGPIPNALPDLVLNGEAAGDQLGLSVSAAGDVNGDGFGDLIVGAYLNDSGGLAAGRAYVYHGGPAMDAVPDLVLTGVAAVDFFGVSVAGVGDVNQDGYDDVVVGAMGNDAGGPQSGRAYLYYGGPGADTQADLTLATNVINGSLGRAVAGAGDVTGDGCVDVIVGAPDGYAGAAYVFDINRYHLLSPAGGETWNVGSVKALSWLGAEPADLWLSTDGGNSYQLQQSSIGGSPSNDIAIRVPHTPTKFARVKLTPSNATIGGGDRSDSLFTIQTSVALLSMLASPSPEGGVQIRWSSDPGPGDLSGYRLERAVAGTMDWQTVVALTRETSVTDPVGGPGSRYRLFAVNGFGEEIWLGETSIRMLKPLTAWPSPYRGGKLTISFASAGGFGSGAARTQVAIYDVQGRMVRRITESDYPQGFHTAIWDGRDGQGRDVGSGVYFLRSLSLGVSHTARLTVLR